MVAEPVKIKPTRGKWDDSEWWNKRHNVDRGGDIVAMAHKIRQHTFELSPATDRLDTVMSQLNYTMRWSGAYASIVPVAELKSQAIAATEQYLQAIRHIERHGLFSEENSSAIKTLTQQLMTPSQLGESGGAVWHHLIHDRVRPYDRDSEWMSDYWKRVNDPSWRLSIGFDRNSVARDASDALGKEDEFASAYALGDLLRDVQNYVPAEIGRLIREVFIAFVVAVVAGDKLTETAAREFLGLMIDDGNFPVNIIMVDRKHSGLSRFSRNVIVLASEMGRSR